MLKYQAVHPEWAFWAVLALGASGEELKPVLEAELPKARIKVLPSAGDLGRARARRSKPAEVRHHQRLLGETNVILSCPAPGPIEATSNTRSHPGSRQA